MLEPLFIHPNLEELKNEELKIDSRESLGDDSSYEIGYTANLIPDVVYRKEESNRIW